MSDGRRGTAYANALWSEREPVVRGSVTWNQIGLEPWVRDILQ